MGKFLLITAVTHHTAKWVGAPYHFVTGMGATFWIAAQDSTGQKLACVFFEDEP